MEIHGALRGLAGREGGCRRILGRLARRFLARAAHQRLGFARVDDYARERLGMSGRELQELARVSRALEALPLVADAFAAGDLSWSQVRLLATVARPETETAWLRRARGATVRALAAMAALAEPDDEALDGEPAAWVSLACPRHVRRLWVDAAELASRMEGARIPAWRAAEAVGGGGVGGRRFGGPGREVVRSGAVASAGGGSALGAQAGVAAGGAGAGAARGSIRRGSASPGCAPADGARRPAIHRL